METNGAAPVDLEGFRSSMRAAGIEEIVEPTLHVYVEEARATFEALQSAVEARDAEAARAAAHSLKSASGNIWAQQAATLFESLEHSAQDGDLEGVDATFGEVKPEFERVLTYLSDAGIAS